MTIFIITKEIIFVIANNQLWLLIKHFTITINKMIVVMKCQYHLIHVEYMLIVEHVCILNVKLVVERNKQNETNEIAFYFFQLKFFKSLFWNLRI